MNLRVPDILTSGNSEKYTVSIRLWPGGLSFAGYIPSDKDSFFYTETAIDLSKSYIQAIKDVFFAYSFFAFDYKRMYVICANRHYTLVPKPIFVEQHKEQLMSFVFLPADIKVLHETLDELESELLFGIQPEVYNFFSRSLICPVFTHALTAQLIQWRQLSLTKYPKCMYASIHEDTLDIACFYREALLFVNSFQVGDATDILYYLLYIWKLTEMDQQKDELTVYANTGMKQTLEETLPTYLSRIEFVVHQETGTGFEVPPDITTLLRCES